MSGDGDVFAADTATVEDKWRESKGTLLTDRNNLVPASEPWLADHERSTFRQARLNRLGSQRAQSHDADARCGIEPFRPYPMQIRIALPGISSNSTTLFPPVPPQVRITPCQITGNHALVAKSKVFPNHTARYFSLFNNGTCFSRST